MRVTLPKLYEKVRAGEPLVALTAYDSSFAAAEERAGVEIILIGDSLGMVCQGGDTTLGVTLDEVKYHTRCVVAGTKQAFILADMPFGSYQASLEQAFASAAALIAAGAQMVKLEGGLWLKDTVRYLTERGIPVMAHLGLSPQYIHQIGGYKVQGRTEKDAEYLLYVAKELEAAGAAALLLELIPSGLADRMTQALSIPTIGIGAGAKCSGQILVLHDILGIYTRKPPRFVKNFLAGANGVEDAIRAYVTDVKSGVFPDAEHSLV
jgi:3-methyl-2-oxobutanoate hydroxymethyltransferase